MYGGRGLRRPALLLAVLAAATLVASASASARSDHPSHAAGYVSLDGATFADFPSQLGSCPNGYSVDCFQFVDQAAIPGLGYVTEEHVVAVDQSSPDCVLVRFTPAVLTVAHRGTLDATFDDPACNSLPSTFTITGGTGVFAGASGGGEFSPQFAGEADSLEDSIIEGYWYADQWTASIYVSNYSADTTPPVLTGAHSRVVLVGPRVRRARVHYTVTAKDDRDGTVPVTCKPKSGSVFKLGRTKVTCTSSDFSANTTTGRFTVTVKRR